MPCDPNDSTLNPPSLPAPAPIGFGSIFGPPQIPFPDIQIPEGIPEDILDLIDRLLTQWPGGPLIPQVGSWAKNVQDALASLLDQLAPFLSLYRFLLPLLNLILCIIEVICALLRPAKLVRAVRKLFKRCLPDFLNLFPWVALIAMIIALILLLIALIEYLINSIIALVEDIIENIIALGEAVSFNDSDRQLAGARKIAQLLCMIEQLFSILIAFQTIFAIIQALGAIGGRSTCARSGTNVGDDGDCCVCPPFLSDNPEGLFGTLGKLIYHRRRDQDITGLAVPISLAPIRAERWQFVDEEEQTYRFSDIITPFDGDIFWPEGLTFDRNTAITRAPYLLDITLPDIDPVIFGHTDTDGYRDFVIKDIIVTKKPTIGYLQFNDSVNASEENNNGTLFLEGGLVYEADGYTPYITNGSQASLNTFINLDPVTGEPLSEDGVFIESVEYNLRFNYEILLKEALITLGCIPEVEIETTIANLTIPSFDTILNRIGPLPDIGTVGATGSATPPGIGTGLPGSVSGTGALGCLSQALAKFRSNVSADAAAVFQQEVIDCLNDLKDQAIDTHTTAVTAGTSVFNTTVTLEPEIQFTGQPITLSVQLRDFNGVIISARTPEESRTQIAQLIEANITFGQITNFTFDGYQSFVATITSDIAGSGEVTLTFDGNSISDVLNQDDTDADTTIQERVLTYQFVGIGQVGGVDAGGGEVQPGQRRDESDVADQG